VRPPYVEDERPETAPGSYRWLQLIPGSCLFPLGTDYPRQLLTSLQTFLGGRNVSIIAANVLKHSGGVTPTAG